MTNLKLAFRTLFKTPFVTVIAVLSLGLGIGANSAIFSLYNQVLLRSLPAHEPGGLVNLGAPGSKDGSTSCNQAGDCDAVFSYLMFRDLERVQTVFTGIAAHRLFSANLAWLGHTESGTGVLVSGSYFPVLGLKAAAGRLLASGDDPGVGESHVVVLGYDYWRLRFSESVSVLGQSLIVNGQAMTIVGVAPRGFNGTTLGEKPHVFVPITMRGFMQPGFVRPPSGSDKGVNGFANRRSYWVYLFARLKSGVSMDQASAALNGQYHAIINDVEAPLQRGMSPQGLARFKAKLVTLEPGAQGQSSMRRDVKVPLRLLLGVTALVLLIACANIANLLLARAATRAGEMAVRLSIGASRRHLVGQLLTESCVLAGLGGLAGLVVAHWTFSLIAWILPPQAVEEGLTLEIDFSVFLAAMTLSAVTGLLFGLFPALHGTRPNLVSALKGQTGQPSGARAAARFRTTLATVQIALSMLLLVCAGLFTRSLLNVSRVDLGLKVDHVVTFRIAPELNGYTPPRSHALFERLEDELSALPGVNSVTASLVPLIAGSNWGSGVSVEGFAAGPDTDTEARYNEIGPGYFQTLGLPVIAGREFTRADALGSPKVAIINEAFAKKFNLGRGAVGKRMSTDGGNNVKLDIEIAGLVQNAKYSEVKQAVPPQFFLPYRQDDALGFINFYVRSSADPELLLGQIPKAVSRLDPNLPVNRLKTMPQQVRESVVLDRLITILSTAFAALATLLAAIGLYGVLAYTVVQRTREIGLRMALGAEPGRVRRMVLTQVGWMTLVGGAIGLIAAFQIGKAARSLLFELQAHDPTALTSAAVLLAAVAFVAGFIPAQRASRVDPMTALRYE